MKCKAFLKKQKKQGLSKYTVLNLEQAGVHMTGRSKNHKYLNRLNARQIFKPLKSNLDVAM